MNPSIDTIFTRSRNALIARAEPCPERSGGTTRNHIEQPGGAGPVDDRGQIDDDSYETRITLSANMFPFMLVHPEDSDLVQMPGLGVNEVVHCGQGEGS